MANIPFHHSGSSDFSAVKTVLFYVMVAAVAIGIAIPAAIATIGAQ